MCEPLFVPGDGFDQAVAEAGFAAEAELALGAAHVQAAARLTVRSAGVPADLTSVAAKVADHFRQFPDGDLLARTEVDGVRLIVAFGGQDDGLGGVVDEQKLP